MSFLNRSKHSIRLEDVVRNNKLSFESASIYFSIQAIASILLLFSFIIIILGEVEDTSAAIEYLISDSASFITGMLEVKYQIQLINYK